MKEYINKLQLLKEKYKTAEHIPDKVYGMAGSNFSPAEGINFEIEKLQRIINYLNGEKPKPGFKLIKRYSNNELCDIDSEYDFDNYKLNKNHPAFLLENIGKTEKQLEIRFEAWKRLIEDPSINNTFKYAYCDKINALIPKGTKLLL